MYKIVILNIKDFVSKNKTLFSITLITQITAFICVLFVFGLIENAVSEKQEVNIQNTTFDVNLVCHAENDEEMIEDSYSFKDIKEKLDDIVNTTNGEWKDFACYGYVKSDDEYYGFCGVNINSQYKTSSDIGISEEEILSGEKVVNVNNVSFPCEIGSVINIGSQQYVISDTDKYYYDAFVIPYNSMNSDFVIRRFKLTLNDIPTKQMVADVGNKIVEHFGLDINMEIPLVPDLMTEQYLRTTFLITLVVILIIAINVCYLYNYILNIQRKKLIVYSILGCSKIKMIQIYSIQMFVITAAADLIALLLFKFTLVNKIAVFYPDIQGFFSTKVYILLYLAYLIIAAAVMVIAMIPSVNRTAIEMRGE